MESYLLVGVILLGVLIVVTSRANPARDMERQVARLERKVDLILGQLGIAYAEELPKGAADLLARGQKIEAIKVYRMATGAGLAEAKAAVEAYQRRPQGPGPSSGEGVA
jgi:ribosomal protein L7/L12